MKFEKAMAILKAERGCVELDISNDVNISDNAYEYCAAIEAALFCMEEVAARKKSIGNDNLRSYDVEYSCKKFKNELFRIEEICRKRFGNDEEVLEACFMTMQWLSNWVLEEFYW
jgi:Zn-dependent oligopeptidase